MHPQMLEKAFGGAFLNQIIFGYLLVIIYDYRIEKSRNKGL